MCVERYGLALICGHAAEVRHGTNEVAPGVGDRSPFGGGCYFPYVGEVAPIPGLGVHGRTKGCGHENRYHEDLEHRHQFTRQCEKNQDVTG